MPEFEISWQIQLSKNSGGSLTPPSASDLAAAYPAIVERVPLISTSTDGGRTGVISISQRTSAGDARTAVLYIRSGNPFASDAGIADVLGDESIDVVVSDLTVTNTETGAVTVHDKGRYLPDDASEGQVARSRAIGSTRRRHRRTVVEAEVVEAEVVEAEVVEAEVVEAEVVEAEVEDS